MNIYTVHWLEYTDTGCFVWLTQNNQHVLCNSQPELGVQMVHKLEERTSPTCTCTAYSSVYIKLQG